MLLPSLRYTSLAPNMARYLMILVILGISATELLAELEIPVTNITTIMGSQFALTAPNVQTNTTNIVRCEIQLPSGVVRPISTEDQFSRIRYVGNGTNRGDCGIRVYNARKEDEGIWTVRTKKRDTFRSPERVAQTVSANVRVTEIPVSVSPSKVTKNEGEIASLSLSFKHKLPNTTTSYEITSCTAILPNGAEISVTPTSTPNPRIKYSFGPDGKAFKDGHCGIVIYDIKPEDNGKWFLKAIHQDSGKEFKGESDFTIMVGKAYILPKDVVIQEKETAVLQLRLENKKQEGTAWVSCYIISPTKEVFQLSGAPPAESTANPNITYTGKGIEKGDCGAKLGPVSPTMKGYWTLYARRSSGSIAEAKGTITLREPVLNYNMENTTTLNSMFSFKCGPEDATECFLTSPTGITQSFHGQCDKYFKITFADIGEWICSFVLPYSTQEIKATTTLKLIDSRHIEVQAVESEKEVTILCQAKGGEKACSSITAPLSCLMERPIGEHILLRPGVRSVGEFKRYSLIGDLGSCNCSMSITKPLVEADYGTWRCVMDVRQKEVMGGFITLAKTGSQPTPSPRKTSIIRDPLSGLVAVNASLTVGCRANRPLAYCWLRSPKGVLFTAGGSIKSQENLSFKSSALSVGECSFTFKPADPMVHSGSWICGMGIADENTTAVDLQVVVDVTVSDSLVLAKQKNVTAAPNDYAVLECGTHFSEAIDYCRFQMPNGSSIKVIDGSISSRFAYFGAGFARGQCGLEIDSVQEEDFGEWTCSVRVRKEESYAEHSAVISLRRQEPSSLGEMSTASVVGLSLGLFVVIAALVSLIAYRYIRIRRAQFSESSSENLEMSSTNLRRGILRTPSQASSDQTSQVFGGASISGDNTAITSLNSETETCSPGTVKNEM